MRAEINDNVLNNATRGSKNFAYMPGTGQCLCKLSGTVEKMPEGIDGIWIVNGKQVLVTKDTVIKERHDRAVVGAHVKIDGDLSGRTIMAYEIEV
ncbi:MAG: hypothetical protein HZC49_03825 [Nitrospirae bacterium]|nr:hypothetical protein [Nitrospirota bacterium]